MSALRLTSLRSAFAAARRPPVARISPRSPPLRPFRLPSRPLTTSVGLRPRLSSGSEHFGSTFGRRFNSTTAPPKSAYQRFKDLTKTYGSYAIIMYLALSAVDFTLTFIVVHAVGKEHIEPAIDKVVRLYRVARHGKAGADALERADAAKRIAEAAEEAADKVLGRDTAWYNNRSLWAEITLAYAIHKVGLLPVRAGLTVAWTPKVVNWLRARGWIGAAGAKRAAQHGADKVRDAGQRAMDAAKDGLKK